MKKRAFTLTELLVVIGIIALLVMVVSPSLTTAWSLARRTICQNNLSKLSTVLAQASGANFSHPNNISQLTEYFPDWQMWPAQAYTTVNDPALFRCPEDDLPKTQSYSNHKLQFKQDNLWTEPLKVPGDNNYYLGRTGFDPAKGKYTEYVFEEAGNILVWAVTPGYGDFWIPTNHNDGYIRIYEMTGELVVISCNCTAGSHELFVDDKPAFNNGSSDMRSNIGRTFRIGAAVPFTNYGVNSFAHRYPYGSSMLVLMDYEGDGITMSADPDEPAKVRQQLVGDPSKNKDTSLRHLGRLNILTADGSVRVVGLLKIDPTQNRTLWNPNNVVPHADDY